MEDIIGLVVTGCQRAKEVEANVLHGAAAMDLPDRCEEIACIFRAASYRLRSLQNDPSSLPLQLQSIASDGDGRENSPSFQLKRTRKDEAMKRTVEVATPLHDDGFTWRKYGQKEILNYQYPRGYYRCTHQRAYGCPAKKQVQRQNNNPDVYQVTYRGQHTCQIPTTRHHGTSHSTPSIDAVTPLVFDNNTSEPEDHGTVADMVDAMFNTINAAPDSIDSIFSNATN